MKKKASTLNVEIQKALFGERFLVFINRKTGKQFLKFASRAEILTFLLPSEVLKIEKNDLRAFTLEKKQLEKAFPGSNL